MVNPVLYADTRQVVSGREGMMLFYPTEADFDASGNDANAVPSLNMLCITTRLGLTINGPDVLGAKMKGYIEGDFTGSTDATINTLRLRHSFINMAWEKSTLLMGQYWYPMVIEEIMPQTQPLNMGAPFHPYARYNQVRYVSHFNNWELLAAAAFQLDNKSQGYSDEGTISNTQFVKQSCVPEFNVQFRYNGPKFFAGVAANVLTMRPKSSDNQLYSSPTFSIFGKYKFSNWTLRTQTLLNNSLYEGCSLGGYIECLTALNATTFATDYSYQQWTFNTIWTDFGRHTGKWRPGIFLGLAQNNNFGKAIYGFDPDNMRFFNNTYGRGINIEYLYRIQPRLGFAAGNGLRFDAEVEYTYAQYGKYAPIEQTTEFTNYGYIHDNNGGVANTRFILSATYAF